MEEESLTAKITKKAKMLSIRVSPDRGELARRLLGAGRRFSPERDAVAELVPNARRRGNFMRYLRPAYLPERLPRSACRAGYFPNRSQ